MRKTTCWIWPLGLQKRWFLFHELCNENFSLPSIFIFSFLRHLDLILCLGFCRSRLCCQVIAKSKPDGIRLAIPAATRNFAVDGYVPKPH